MVKIDGQEFWQRVDGVLHHKKMNYRILCKKTGIEYRSINTQRTRHALPKAEQLYTMSSLLNVTMEYLLTGKKSSDISEEAQAIEYDSELKYLVKLCMEDRSLISFLSHVRGACKVE